MLSQLRSEEDHKNLIEQGFTLVELLIVIVILGILAGIVVFAVGNLTSTATNHACATEMNTFETAIQSWYAANPTANLAFSGTNDTAGAATAFGLGTTLAGVGGNLAGASLGYFGGKQSGATVFYAPNATSAAYWSYTPGGSAGVPGTVTAVGTCK